MGDMFRYSPKLELPKFLVKGTLDVLLELGEGVLGGWREGRREGGP
jgi:hypothetical protein